MPIYIEFDGIKRTVESSRQAGGANFAMSDGSVKNFGRSSGNGGPRVIVFDGNNQGLRNVSSGHKFTLERHFDAGGAVFTVSRISLPNSSAGAVDAFAPNAVVNAKALFEAQKSTVTTLGVIFSIPPSAANKIHHTNNLKQLGLAAHGQISTVRFFITDNSDPAGVTVELQNCLISNYTISSHGGSAHAAWGQGKVVKIDFCKTN